jgi:membrane protein YdbS with pleckstrin-like domain
MKFVDKVMHVTAAAIIVSFLMLMSAVAVDMPAYFINELLWMLVAEYVILASAAMYWWMKK